MSKKNRKILFESIFISKYSLTWISNIFEKISLEIRDDTNYSNFSIELTPGFLKLIYSYHSIHLQRSNSLINWSLNTAEHSFVIATASVQPAIQMLNKPIFSIDRLLCQSIDIVEERIPNICLPPELVSIIALLYFFQ